MIDADELARFTAIAAPTGSEEARIRWLEDRLSGQRGSLERDEVGNLVWRFGGSPELLLMAHVDTVFHGLDTIDVVRDDGGLIGPGVGDNAAAVMTVIWALLALDSIPPGIAVAFTVGEEGLGNLRGALHVCRSLQPSMAIALEGHGLDQIVTEHVGSTRAHVTVTGPGGHSWADRGTPSAIHALLPIGSELAASGANIGTISGGSAVNAIAAEAELLVERRSIDQAELDAFETEVRGRRVDDPLRVECEIVGRRPAGRIERDHPLVRAIVEAHRSLGLPERFEAGSTDANAAAAFGIPAASIGCTRGSGMHTPHERIELEPLELGVGQLLAVVEAFADRRIPTP
ncbi:MAG TPA: M20/M25/M40 family metallo-hydrolase [Solirubrobacteraceae bacterium]|nr:M20/M25/M40 family metallo-hydrolase [Solirubrobacteraceae bacterium]